MRYLILLLLLTGCGGAEPTFVEPDSISKKTNIKIKYLEGGLSLEKIDAIYIDVMECLGITRHGPFIFIVDFEPYGYDGYSLPSGLIYISKKHRHNGLIYRHEFLHHISKDYGHSNPIFQTCKY